MEVRTNNVGPAIEITAASDAKSGSPIGTNAHYTVSVENTGNDAALTLKAGNFTDATLVQGGAVWTFNMSVPVTSLVQRNFTQTFTVTWTAPDGTPGTLTSNADTLTLSHNGVLLPLMEFSYASTLSPEVLASGKANATYTLTNSGTAGSTSTTVTQPFASGVSCTSVVSGNATCSGSSLTLSTGPVAPGNNVIGQAAMSFGTDNYVSSPASITASYQGITLQTRGDGYVLPAGLTVVRTDSPNPIFQGENDTVTMSVINTGTLPVYNMSVSTQPDSFDRAVSGSLFKLYPVVNASTTDSFNYTTNIVTPGNHTTAQIILSYAFAGYAASYSAYSGTVEAYKAVTVTTTTKPNVPTEGSDFALAVSIENPSKTNVTNVSLSLPVPQGLTIANSSSAIEVRGHTLYISLPSLGAGVTSTHFIAVKSGTDGTFAFGTGSLSFQYLGQTINGIINAPAISVGVDLLLRYEIPIGAAVVLTILVAVYMHRKLSVPQPK